MSFVNECEQRVLSNEILTKKDALALAEQPLEELCSASDRIRRNFCKDRFDLCTIINAKSGRCSENCKFCAQSAYYHAEVKSYPLLPKAEITERVKSDYERGVLRFSLVTSGRHPCRQSSRTERLQRRHPGSW